MSATARYAIYYAPDPGSALWRFGSGVIGYNAANATDLPLNIPVGCTDLDWHQLTREPRRYGFHATLKAPFRLGQEATEHGLIALTEKVAATEAAFELDGLRVALLGSFVALVPARDTGVLNGFAMRIVEAFEPMRAALTEEEMTRRLKVPLSPAQRINLDSYGYPYVGAEFRFHMTLTGSLPATIRDRVATALASAYKAAIAPGPLRIDRIALFVQDSADVPFRILRTFDLCPLSAGGAR
jgi:putative phosphonate metabolism protein